MQAWIGTVLCLVVLVATDAPYPATLELFFLQDATESFRNSLPQITSLMPSFGMRLAETWPNTKIGMAMYGDRTHPKLRPGDDISTERNVLWRMVQPLTHNLAQFETSCANLTYMFEGGTTPEAGFDALTFAIGSAAGFSNGENTVKFAVLITDAPSHYADENEPAIPVNMSSKPVPPEPERHIYDGIEYSYVSSSQVKRAIDNKRVRAVYLVKDGLGAWYRSRMQAMGFAEGEFDIIPFPDTGPFDASDLFNKLYRNIEQVTCTVAARTTGSIDQAESGQAGDPTGDTGPSNPPAPDDGPDDVQPSVEEALARYAAQADGESNADTPPTVTRSAIAHHEGHRIAIGAAAVGVVAVGAVFGGSALLFRRVESIDAGFRSEEIPGFRMGGPRRMQRPEVERRN